MESRARQAPSNVGRLARWAGYIGTAVLTAPITVMVVFAMASLMPSTFTEYNDNWILVAVAPVPVAAVGLLCFRRTRPYGGAVLLGLLAFWILVLIVFSGIGDNS